MPPRKPKTPPRAETYEHSVDAVLRPEVGTQSNFKKRRAPRTYRYDSSLSPSLEWDGQNSARELGDWLISQIEEAAALAPPHKFSELRQFGHVTIDGLDEAVKHLRLLGKSFLNWAGKAERQSFDVPTLPLFVHERLSTRAILETLKGHERDRQIELQLFGDPQLSLAQQLEAYEHTGGWVNRLILGDSLIVMNSLLEYEGLGGQIQMIYIDPPYGVQFGSNFQPFVRKRDVRDGDDESLTREPEMVQAYRDTWELGVHSYLTYLRDRLLTARDLLTSSGSVFIQIGDENVHLVRSLLDEVMGSENFVSQLTVAKTSGVQATALATTADFLLWYAKSKGDLKYRQLYVDRTSGADARYDQVMLPDGVARPMTAEEKSDPALLPIGAKRYQLASLTSDQFRPDTTVPFEFDGRTFHPGARSHWKTTVAGLHKLADAGRLEPARTSLRYRRYLDDFPARELNNVWTDISGSVQSRSDPKVYVVQSSTSLVERCMQMTTDPGDLVLDPTCGSGTTAFVAEQWGRRWITIDTSRVPIALARQRLLTATFPYYELQDRSGGPARGFVYKRRQSAGGKEIGGIVPHVTLKSIANDDPPSEELLVDRPEVETSIVRISGPFCFEATIPTPLDDAEGVDDEREEYESSARSILEVLRRSPTLRLSGKDSIDLINLRELQASLTLGAEGEVKGSGEKVALVFGPSHSAVSERMIYESAREAHARSYDQLIVIGFAIEANARSFVDKCATLVGISATYVQATPDLIMGDLLKTMRSSEIFSVTGLPDVQIDSVLDESGSSRFTVELRGLDIFDPTTMNVDHRDGDDVPAWFLDTDFNDLCFHVSQAFFPRTSAWDSLKRALKGTYEEGVWDHLAGTRSAPFTAGEFRKVAVKVIDDRGNELMIVQSLDETT